MTIKEYLRDGALAGEAKVIELIADPSPVVRLDHSWFHPQGGGQKGDRGRLGPVRVLDVRHGPDGAVDHHVDSLEGLSVGQTLPFEIDLDWRRDNAVSHSSGHLIAAVCERLFVGFTATSGHHWPGEARVEFVGEDLERIQSRLGEVEVALADCLAAKLPVDLHGEPLTDRAIRIGDFAAVPCGGTHVSSLGEIGAISIRSVKIKGGKARVSYESAASNAH